MWTSEKKQHVSVTANKMLYKAKLSYKKEWEIHYPGFAAETLMMACFVILTRSMVTLLLDAKVLGQKGWEWLESCYWALEAPQVLLNGIEMPKLELQWQSKLRVGVQPLSDSVQVLHDKLLNGNRRLKDCKETNSSHSSLSRFDRASGCQWWYSAWKTSVREPS